MQISKNRMTKETLTTQIYVGFWVRFAAFLLDSLAIMGMLWVVALFVPLPDGFGAIDMTNQKELLAIAPTLLARVGFDAVFSAIIFLLLWSLIRWSFGKILFRAYIVDSSGNKASFYQLLIRYLGYFASLIFLGLGFLWIAFDKKKQGWHDKLAGTVVIYDAPAKTETSSHD